MNHFLRTVNPEASEAIQPAPAARRMPGVGEMVIYHMRHGHARQGRTRFPAMVQGQTNERGTSLNLTVILEAGELRNETLVEEIGAGGDNGHVWERPDNTALAEVFRGTITSLHQRIGELEEEVRGLYESRNLLVDKDTEMERMILGDYAKPKVALFEIFAAMEKRLQAVEAAGNSKKK